MFAAQRGAQVDVMVEEVVRAVRARGEEVKGTVRAAHERMEATLRGQGEELERAAGRWGRR